jgi:hypothetical protein
MRKRRLVGAGIALLLAALPAAAQAEDDTWIWGMAKAAGDPLEVAVGEGASLHANLDGSGPSDIFWFDEAGLTVAISEADGSVHPYGTVSNEFDKFKLVSQPVTTGSGTSADPWTISSTWNAGDPARLRITEVVRFTNGSQRFGTTWTIENVSGGPLNFRAYLSASISDSFCVPVARSNGTVPGSVGVAVPLDGGPRDPNDPVFDGLDFGRATDLEPDPAYPWTHAVAGEGPPATGAIYQGQPLPASLPARTDQQALVAAEWDGHAPGKAALAPGATYTVGARLHHASALRAPPMIASTLDTAPYTLDVYTDTADGGPLANERLGWYIESYSHRVLTGTMTTDSTGHASLTWTSDGQEHDDVTVWIDRNGNGRWDRDIETTRKTQVEWVDQTGVSWGGHDTPGSGTNGTDVTATGGGVTSVSGGPGAGSEILPTATQPVGTTRASMTVSRLAIKRISARTIRVVGRSSMTTSKRVAFALRSPKGRLLGRTSARVKAGRFAVRMKLTKPIRPGRYKLAMRYAGDGRIRPLVSTRAIRIAR